MDHLRRLGDSISIPIPADEEGFTGHECPKEDCEGYFKIEIGTGLTGKDLPCYCPYCGYVAGHDQFWTKEQIEYARSVAIRKVTDALHKDLKKLEFDHKPRGDFGIGISMKVHPGRPTPIHQYREKQLETEVVCANCTLRYSVYGVFAFCPDCGEHNSLQIFDKNLDVVGKMLELARGAEPPVAEKLIENALEDCVSAFDGFGREVCRLYAQSARNQGRVERLNTQNLEAARRGFVELFGLDPSVSVPSEAWRAAVTAFQKRHLVAHKMGVVDQQYITNTGDTNAVVGRKIGIHADEVRDLTQIMGTISQWLSENLRDL